MPCIHCAPIQLGQKPSEIKGELVHDVDAILFLYGYRLQKNPLVCTHVGTGCERYALIFERIPAVHDPGSMFYQESESLGKA